MLDFLNFYNPTQIIFGQNRLNEVDQLVPADSKTMILYGGGSAKKFGTIDRIRKICSRKPLNSVG